MNFSLYLFQPYAVTAKPSNPKRRSNAKRTSDAARDRAEPRCHEANPFLRGFFLPPSLLFSNSKRETEVPLHAWVSSGGKGVRVHGKGWCVGHPCMEVGEDERSSSLHLPPVHRQCLLSQPELRVGRRSPREAAKGFLFVSFRATRV